MTRVELSPCRLDSIMSQQQRLHAFNTPWPTPTKLDLRSRLSSISPHWKDKQAMTKICFEDNMMLRDKRSSHLCQGDDDQSRRSQALRAGCRKTCLIWPWRTQIPVGERESGVAHKSRQAGRQQCDRGHQWCRALTLSLNARRGGFMVEFTAPDTAAIAMDSLSSIRLPAKMYLPASTSIQTETQSIVMNIAILLVSYPEGYKAINTLPSFLSN